MPVVTGVFTADFALRRSFTGQHIMESVRDIAGDAYYESYFYKNGNCYSLGCKAPDITRNLKLTWFYTYGPWATYWIREKIYNPGCQITVSHFDWDHDDISGTSDLKENDCRQRIAGACFTFFEELRNRL
jgi:hypothetical protein